MKDEQKKTEKNTAEVKEEATATAASEPAVKETPAPENKPEAEKPKRKPRTSKKKEQTDVPVKDPAPAEENKEKDIKKENEKPKGKEVKEDQPKDSPESAASAESEKKDPEIAENGTAAEDEKEHTKKHFDKARYDKNMFNMFVCIVVALCIAYIIIIALQITNMAMIRDAEKKFLTRFTNMKRLETVNADSEEKALTGDRDQTVGVKPWIALYGDKDAAHYYFDDYDHGYAFTGEAAGEEICLSDIITEYVVKGEEYCFFGDSGRTYMISGNRVGYVYDEDGTLLYVMKDLTISQFFSPAFSDESYAFKDQEEDNWRIGKGVWGPNGELYQGWYRVDSEGNYIDEDADDPSEKEAEFQPSEYDEDEIYTFNDKKVTYSEKEGTPTITIN